MESGLRGKNGSECSLAALTLSSPLGKIQVAGCENGVHEIQILTDGIPAERTVLWDHPLTEKRDSLKCGVESKMRAGDVPSACVVCEGQVELSGPLRVTVDWLQAYFSAPQTVEKLPLPAFHHPLLLGVTFTGQVLQTLLKEVKVGETVSYKRLAEMAGNSKAVRAVGGAMRRNPVPLLIPCHRVIASSGQSGNYMGGKGNHLKQWLLAHEKP